MAMLKVLLLRHAQCEMNLHITERIGGRTNASPLTSLGELQARALGAHLQAALLHAGTPPQQLSFYSSTAVRAVATAKHVMAALQVGGRVGRQACPAALLCFWRGLACVLLCLPPLLPLLPPPPTSLHPCACCQASRWMRRSWCSLTFCWS